MSLGSGPYTEDTILAARGSAQSASTRGGHEGALLVCLKERLRSSAAGHARERLCFDDPRLLTAPSISSDTPCPLRVSPASGDAPLHLRVSPANGDAPRPLRVSPVSGDTPSRLRVSPASSEAPRPLTVSPASGDTPSRLRVSPESGDAPSLPDSAVVHRCYGDHGCAALLGDGQRAGGRREGNGGLAAGERMNRNGLDRARMTGSESPAASDSLTWLAARGVVSTAPTTSSGAPGAGRDPPTAGRDPASLGRSPSVGRSDPVVAGAGYTGLYRLPAPGRLYGGDQLHTTATTTAPGYPSVYTGPTALSPFGAYLYPYRAYPPHPESFSAVLHNISTQHAHQVVPPPPPPPPAQFLAPHAPHAAPAGFKAETRHSPDGYRTGPATSRKHHMLVAPRPEPAATARHHSEPPPAKRHRTTPQPAPSPGAPPPALPPPPPLQPALVPPRPSCRPHYPPHFHRGSVIELASGQLKRVEELRTDDFIGSADVSDDLQIDSSTVTRIEPQPERATASLGFSVGENHVQVTVEATLEHPFFVFHRGWSSCQPARTLERYGLQCHQLLVGDVCISLTQKTPGGTERSAERLGPPPASDGPAAGRGAVVAPGPSRWPDSGRKATAAAMPPPLPPVTAVVTTPTTTSTATADERSAMKESDDPRSPPTK